MKTTLAFAFYSLFSLSGLTLAVLHQINNADHFELVFGLFPYILHLNMGGLALIIMIICACIILLQLFTYEIIFRANFYHHHQRNVCSFFTVIMLKYLIPFLILVTTSVNGETLMQGIPVPATIFQAIMACSLLIDWVIFYFEYDEKKMIPYTIFNRQFHIPSKKAYNTMFILLWSTIAFSLAYKYQTRISQKDKNISE